MILNTVSNTYIQCKYACVLWFVFFKKNLWVIQVRDARQTSFALKKKEKCKIFTLFWIFSFLFNHCDLLFLSKVEFLYLTDECLWPLYKSPLGFSKGNLLMSYIYLIKMEARQTYQYKVFSLTLLKVYKNCLYFRSRLHNRTNDIRNANGPDRVVQEYPPFTLHSDRLWEFN